MCGSCFSSIGLVTVGYLDDFGTRNFSGFYIAIWSFSSGISAFVSGSIHWKMNETRRFIYSLISFFIVTIPIFLVAHLFRGNLFMLGVALFLNGLAIAPLITAALTVAERSVSEKRTTEVLAWAVAALNLGGAIPAVITGYIIDTYGSSVAFIVPLACAAIALLSLIPFLGLWRRKLHQIPA